MSTLLKILQFLRIVDEDQRLSITNIAVFIAIFKLATTQTSPMDMGVLFTSLLNYAHTKRVRAQLGTQDDVTDGN